MRVAHSLAQPLELPRQRSAGRLPDWCRTPDSIQPRRSGDQRGPDRRRPQHVAPGRQAPIPAVDDELRIAGRGPVIRRRRPQRDDRAYPSSLPSIGGGSGGLMAAAM
jgi:hypothetical protein